MGTLNRKKHFATVFGTGINHRFEQDGKLFDHDGMEVDKDGIPVRNPEDALADVPEESPEDKTYPCTYPGCTFIAKTPAGKANHERQAHQV